MGFLDFFSRPRKKHCARCGQVAIHGYSRAAESCAKDITPLCVSCLDSQLLIDYRDFGGRAVLIAPAIGVPCYVFRNRECLRSISPDSAGLYRELDQLLSTVQDCSDCGTEAHCLWIQSKGLNGKTFDDIIKIGVGNTLLAWGNPQPLSLCGVCSARRIAECLRDERLSYSEVCSPQGTEQGVVLPMAY